MRRIKDGRSSLSIPRSRLAKSVLGWPRPAKRLLMFASDLIGVPVALWAAFALKYDSLSDGFEHDPTFYIGVAAASTSIFAAIGLYRAVVRYIGGRVLVSIATGVFGSALVLWLLGKTIALQAVPFSVVVIFTLLALVWIAGTRLVARWLLTPVEKNGIRVVIYGAGDAGAQLSMAISSDRQFTFLAYVDEKYALQGTSMNGVPVITPDQLADFTERNQVDRILLAVPSASRRRRAEILRRLEALNVHIQSVPDLHDVVSGRAKVDELREVDVADLLGRDPVPPHCELLDASIRDKCVMVSGAGGSIGSELCRQIVLLAPKRVVLFEMSEFALYDIERELSSIIQSRGLSVEVFALLGNAHHKYRVRDVLQSFGVQTVYHAAAYKHVPIVEENLIEGVHNNVFGTWHAAEAALEIGVETFVLISTDKAVNPTNVMGATKRLAEIALQALQTQTRKTRFCMVRFGNVLGSSGSVVPLFQEQIRHGGPVTVTHHDVRRYFMTIQEAAQLVLQAGSMGTGGDVFVLDMGEPVQIDDLARRMIKLTGLSVRDKDHPEGDIEIQYSGLRPGEKLYEELLIGSNVTGTGHPMIMRAIESCPTWDEARALLEELAIAVGRSDCKRVLKLLEQGVKEYSRAAEIHDLVWRQRPAAEAAMEAGDPKVTVLAEHRSQKISS
ncbi:MAG: polysaccharide biosynthesis protein [Steroidobacteraceae bacterium]